MRTTSSTAASRDSGARGHLPASAAQSLPVGALEGGISDYADSVDAFDGAAEYAARRSSDFSYAITNDVNAGVAIKIVKLETYQRPPLLTPRLGNPFLEVDLLREPHDYYISVELKSKSPINNILPFAEISTHSSVENDEESSICTRSWNEWIDFPIRICDLPIDVYLQFKAYDIVTPEQTMAVGKCSISLFDELGCLRRGTYRLEMGDEDEPKRKISSLDEIQLIDMEKRMRLLEIREITKIRAQDEIAEKRFKFLQKRVLLETKKSFLHIVFPVFDLCAIYGEDSLVTLNGNLYDPELDRDNLVEMKHRLLARSHRSGVSGDTLKPNSRIRDELAKIIAYPRSRQLTPQEKDLVWNYRHYLSRNKRALIKFLTSVSWSDSVETQQALEMLARWQEPEIGDVLGLFGPDFANPGVRAYAVERVSTADDAELSLYLLQLVQALKYEAFTIHEEEEDQLSELNATNCYIKDSCMLSDFLLERATRSENISVLLYWYLYCETKSKVHGTMYRGILDHLTAKIRLMPNGLPRLDILNRQQELLEKLSGIVRSIKSTRDTLAKKLERLIGTLKDPVAGLEQFPPLPLPLDPNIRVVGILADKTKIFKSTQMPIKIVFVCEDGSEYPTIYKQGDDLRQDQLVIQVVSIMNQLLQKDNLDLKLTPYKVLATGLNEGFVQFIDSYALADVLSERGTIRDFLRRHNQDNSSASINGISPSSMDSYLRSCAGYCVITHLLGVGDRHLDNLMLTKEGRMFHIDFGFILGRDPKPFPPPMKLCKEMVEAMGGASSGEYKMFLDYCFVSYTTLRKHLNLFINLFNLMIDASIPDLAIESTKVPEKLIEKFKPELSDEAAITHFRNLISESVNALFPVVIEAIHKWAQYWLH